jgi:DNA-binding ferritin-like protein
MKCLHSAHQLIPVPPSQRRCRKLTESADTIASRSATVGQSSSATAQASINTSGLLVSILMLSNDIECMVNIIEGETIVHRINDMLNEDDSVCGK